MSDKLNRIPVKKDEKKHVVAKARKRFEKGNKHLMRYFKELYNNRKAESRALNPDAPDGQIIEAVKQKVFSNNSSYKSWIALEHPDIAESSVWAKINMQTLFPEELQPGYIHKEQQRSKRKRDGKLKIESLHDFHRNMVDYALELVARIEVVVTNNITPTSDVVMPLAAPIMYSLVLRKQCLAFGRENFEFRNGLCHQIRTSKNDHKKTVFPLLGPELTKRLLDLYYEHATWSLDAYSKRDMFDVAEKLGVVGEMTMYKLKHIAMTAVPYLFDLEHVGIDPFANAIRTRRCFAGHRLGSASNEDYAVVKIVDPTCEKICALRIEDETENVLAVVHEDEGDDEGDDELSELLGEDICPKRAKRGLTSEDT